MRTTISAIALTCLVLASCNKSKPDPKPPAPGKPAAAEQEGAFLKDIDAAAAGKLVAGGENPPVVLDVRTAEEFAAGHIEDAINLDFKGAGFKDELAKLDRDQTYLLHCRSGNRSGQAKATLLELGFTAIYHLDGGMLAWEKAGLPTVEP